MLISEVTSKQLSELELDLSRPLLICDVDEVILHFLSDFEIFANDAGYHFDAANHNWGSNIRYKSNGEGASQHDSGNLIELYFATRTRHMKPIDHAVDSLLALSNDAEIVLLTNLPHSAGDHRRENLLAHGLAFPVITNSGPKGPAIRHLSMGRSEPVVFIDDSPGFVQSARDHAPDVHIIHFVQDVRVARTVPEFDFISLKTDSWHEVRSHAQMIFRGSAADRLVVSV
jgi:hypothetical protein